MTITSPQPLFVARLTGTQEEMGAQHGRLVAADAMRLFEFYRTMPERTLVGDLQGSVGSVGRWVARHITNAMQARLVKDRPADDVARTRAFVEAVRAIYPAHDTSGAARALATMDSLQNCVSFVGRTHLGPFAKPLIARAVTAAIPACSTAIAWGSATADGELLFGRNFDFPGIGVWDAAPAFVLCAPDRGQRYGFFTTRGADTPVVTVVNEAGLVIAPHTRWHRDVTWGGAMIIDLIHAIARRAETLADAIAIARERPASSSWGIAIGSARERSALVIEVAGPQVEVVRPPPGAEFLVCMNRYRNPAIEDGQLAASVAWIEQSDRRERRMRALIEQRSAPLGPRDLAGFLGDRQESAGPRRRLGAALANVANVHCVVAAPAQQRAWLGVDRAPCCEGDWAELGWAWNGPTGGWELGAPELAAAGFTAARLPDFVAPQDAATRHVHDATRAYESAHDIPTTRAALERAVAADPADPSLYLAAAWLALEDDAPDRSVVHVHAGLACETDPFRRAQLLLWGSRAARTSDAALAKRWTDELGRMSGDGIAELQAASHRKFRGRPHVNLLMADAY